MRGILGSPYWAFEEGTRSSVGQYRVLMKHLKATLVVVFILLINSICTPNDIANSDVFVIPVGLSICMGYRVPV